MNNVWLDLPSVSGSFAWTLAWQSTLWLALGLLAGRVLRPAPGAGTPRGRVGGPGGRHFTGSHPDGATPGVGSASPLRCGSSGCWNSDTVARGVRCGRWVRGRTTAPICDDRGDGSRRRTSWCHREERKRAPRRCPPPHRIVVSSAARKPDDLARYRLDRVLVCASCCAFSRPSGPEGGSCGKRRLKRMPGDSPRWATRPAHWRSGRSPCCASRPPFAAR